MTTCNNIILQQPQANDAKSYDIPSDVSARLNFGSEEISGLSVGDNGELIISFNNDGQLSITNFEDVIANGNLLMLNDGTLIDPAVLTSSAQSPQSFNNIEAAAGAATNADTVVISKPEANTTQSVSVEQGMQYVCNFDPANAATVEVNGDQMVLTFADGSQVVINNFQSAAAGQLPEELTLADAEVIEVEELLTEVTEVAQPIEELLEFAEVKPEEDVAEQVANIAPAAGEVDIVETLAQIEPAAGEVGGVGNTGFGFNSSPIDISLNSPDAIGPLGPTQLAFSSPTAGRERIRLSDDAPSLSTSNVVLDETNLGANDLTATGSVNVDFGADGIGSILPNGNFSASQNLANGVLSSGGVPVNVSATPNGYVGVANGVTVFTFVIDPTTGDYVYTQIEPFDHSDTSDTNEAIGLQFGIVASDADGDSVSTVVNVTVLDDAPVTGDDTNTIDEDALSAGPIVITDSVSVDFGSDGAGSLAPSGTFTSGGSLDNGVLSSNGQAITVTQTANGYVGTANGVTIFTLNIDSATGDYTFTQFGPLDHADNNDANDVISLNFGTVITDFDGDSEPGQIIVNIVDSAPVFQTEDPTIGNGVENLDETNEVNVGGQLEADFGGDNGTFQATGGFAASGSVLGGNLTSCGDPVVVTFDSATNTYTGVAGGETVFTLSIDAATGEYTYSQPGSLDHADANDPNDVITLTFDVDAVDSEGDAARGSIIVNVRDDAPEVQDVIAGTTDETDGGAKLLSGQITGIDFGNDSEGSVAGNGDFTSSGSRTGNALNWLVFLIMRMVQIQMT